MHVPQIDKKAFASYVALADKCGGRFKQIQLEDGNFANFVLNDKKFDCFITKDGNLIAGKGFKTNKPKNFAKGAVEIIHQLPCGHGKKNEIIDNLFIYG